MRKKKRKASKSEPAFIMAITDETLGVKEFLCKPWSAPDLNIDKYRGDGSADEEK